jgi:hypothetical protein
MPVDLKRFYTKTTESLHQPGGQTFDHLSPAWYCHFDSRTHMAAFSKRTSESCSLPRGGHAQFARKVFFDRLHIKIW